MKNNYLRNILVLLLTLLLAGSLNSCKNSPNEISTFTDTVKLVKSLPEWAKNSNIYEVNIRQFTPEGTFKAFQEHLPRLKKWVLILFG